MINKRKTLTTLIILTLTTIFAACGKTEQQEPVIDITPPVSANADAISDNEITDIPAETLSIIKSVVTTYQNDKDKDSASIAELFDELDALDSDKASVWRSVIDYWDYLTYELTLNEGDIPDDIDNDNSLCIVVLGYQLNDDGTMREELIGRLETALMCAEEYDNAYVLCTGGGTAKNAPDKTEAGSMGEWLVQNGIDESRIIIEDDSMSTVDNALYSDDIIINSYPTINSVMIVTSDYHIAWGSLLFETVFINSYIRNGGPEIHVVSNCAYDTEDGDTKINLVFDIEANNLKYMAERIN